MYLAPWTYIFLKFYNIKNCINNQFYCWKLVAIKFCNIIMNLQGTLVLQLNYQIWYRDHANLVPCKRGLISDITGVLGGGLWTVECRTGKRALSPS